MLNNLDCSGLLHFYLVRDTFPLSFRPLYQSEENEYITLNCNDYNQPLTALRLYQVDSKGNTTYCKVFVKLEDKFSLCKAENISISGKITLSPGHNYSGFRIKLAGTNELTTSTNNEGDFKLDGVKPNTAYTLQISKESQYLAGISTYDLLLINRHILGIRPLISKYSFVAADVNNSGSVTTLDMVLLKKMILQIEKIFPNNTNWHFFDKLGQEKISISTLTPLNLGEIIGIKTGDVSGAEQIK
jgi:hypothetical protein